jgi:hypothetical protein
MVKERTGVCRLCLKQTALRNSHILPEFFYLGLYDELHRAVNVSSSTNEKFIQKGLREYLLCQKCETKFSKYEGYASKLLQRIPKFYKDPSGNFIYSDQVDYKKFKLFQLSLLWRAGVSENFVQVNLGKHEEKIRYMLDEEIPGRFFDYGCWLVMYPNPKKINRIIWSPATVKLDGHNGYKFMTGNLLWYFFVTSHSPKVEFQSLFLQESGLLKIWLDPQGEEIVYKNMIKALNARKVK